MKANEIGAVIGRPNGTVLMIAGSLATLGMVDVKHEPTKSAEINLTQKGVDTLAAILSGRRRDIEEDRQLHYVDLCFLMLLGWSHKESHDESHHSPSESPSGQEPSDK